MSKRNITFTKPEEPEFLKKLKKQAGYQEGPTVETKKEQLGPAEDRDCEDERPTVVVLNEGDLTAEEALKLEKEAEETPADLNTRIFFKAPKKKTEDQPSKTITNVKKVKSKTLLSFDEEEDDD